MMATMAENNTVPVKINTIMPISRLIVKEDPRLAIADETAKNSRGITAVSNKSRKISPIGLNFNMTCGANCPRTPLKTMLPNRYRTGE